MDQTTDRLIKKMIDRLIDHDSNHEKHYMAFGLLVSFQYESWYNIN